MRNLGKTRVLSNLPVLFLMIGLLSGCVSPGSPVVTDRSLGARGQQTYVVKQGDTLYSIAWRFGLDHQRLAAANSVGAPFTIYPGQKIRLSEVVSRSTNKQKPAPSAEKVAIKPELAKAPAKPAGKSPPEKRAKPPVKAPVTKAAPATTQRAAKPKPPPKGSNIWHRPLSQKPSSLFSKTNKGLDYAITARARVRSARDGEVVYAGNGIAGFERLVILKHSGELLSAYSFNGKMLVAEQQRVNGGEVIAEILPRPGVGQTLHFEVRRKGVPINPQKL